MAYRDFQHFLEVLEAKGELRRIAEPVSPYLEITEISDRVMKTGGPALLFESVVGRPHRLGTPNQRSAIIGQKSIHDESDSSTGGSVSYDFPVAINTMGSRKRMSLALSCEDFEEHAERVAHLLKPDVPRGLLDKARFGMELLKEVKPTQPKEVS
ncbi:MAG TPA: hypothetical protein VJ835_09165, partial [Fimbriimonadaceae bacterium]|nr:hypothetical protein [Fimbriimonadaceae bacterium]